MGKHLVQAVPFVNALQYLTGKVDNNNNRLIKDIFFLNLEGQKLTVAELKPFSKVLLRKLTKNGEIVGDDQTAKEVIEKLVENNNTIRYKK